MPTPFGGRDSMRSTHSWLSSKSTCVQSMPSDAYTSCSSLNRCLPGATPTTTQRLACPPRNAVNRVQPAGLVGAAKPWQHYVM